MTTKGSAKRPKGEADEVLKPPAGDALVRATELGIDVCGRIAHFWGFTRTMGRAFGLLFLSKEILPQTEIQRRLKISMGNASMTLAGLEKWGVVHRVKVKGSRREHYQAETDFWKMISRVLDQRERKEISVALQLMAQALESVELAKKTTQGKAREGATFAAERLADLHAICRQGELMLDLLLGQMNLDARLIGNVLGGKGSR